MNLPARPSPIPAAVLDRIKDAVGPKGYLADPDEIAPLTRSWRDNWQGWVPLVVRPASTAEVAEVVRICAETRTPIVPQGGNTGLTGASQPHDDGSEIILSTSRLNRIRDIDLGNDTMTVEAGCILAELQAAARDVNRLLPLSLAAEGSCQIGGNLATNAGGTQVLRYGNARALALGLEVVLPDGRIWDGLRGLRKDYTGYDLKQLFIGAEGTLGIITAAVLRLFPKPRETATAFAALRDVAAAVELLARTRAAVGEVVTSFELIPRRGLEFAMRHVAGVNDPLADPHAWYALVELSAGAGANGLGEALEGVLAQAYEDGLVPDATLAASAAQTQDFWRIREGVVEGQKFEGGSIKHDVSVPVSDVPAFMARATAAVDALIPGIRPVAFGHIGDGNIHFNLSQPEGADTAAYLARWEEVNRLVHDVVTAFDGSISAEHGIGRMKVEENRRLKPALDIHLMRQVKAAFDPHNLMNPGKVVEL